MCRTHAETSFPRPLTSLDKCIVDGKYNGGFYHTKALQDGKADLATLIFYNFEVVEARSLGLAPRFFSLKDWGVPDFCQLVLFTTPQRLASMQPALRKLVLAVRRATGFIHRDPARAAKIFSAHAKESAAAAAATGNGTSWLTRVGDALNPLAALKRKRDAKLEAATMHATLPAFPNDNSIAESYFADLMKWLVRTRQVEAAKAEGVAPGTYWTNGIAL